MGILLILVGLLGLASGGLKMRMRVRATVGHSSLAIVEAILGAATLVGSGVGLARVRPLAWTLVFATLVLTIVSTWVHARCVGNYVRKRKESEALRLKTYLLSREYSE
jgi:membrane protein implicated in regulation of membrane protease activity